MNLHIQSILKSYNKIISINRRIRGIIYTIAGFQVKSIGTNCKIRGTKFFCMGKLVSLGDFCWIEAIERYNGIQFHPVLKISNETSLSDLVHISCANNIIISDKVLIGSKVYIGDHAHGYGPNIKNLGPAHQPLMKLGSIYIGSRCWLGDGCVVLADTYICDDCVISANSVVKNLNVKRPAIIAGNPAKIIKYLD